jgi:hypothetical protein
MVMISPVPSVDQVPSANNGYKPAIDSESRRREDAGPKENCSKRVFSASERSRFAACKDLVT